MTTAVLQFDIGHQPVRISLTEYKAYGAESVRRVVKLLPKPVTMLSDDSKSTSESVRLALPLLGQIESLSSEDALPWDRIPRIGSLVRNEAVRLAMTFADIGLRETRDEHEVVMPSLHPTAHGAIQFEWHRNGLDLEVEALPSGKIIGFLEHPGEEPVEFDLSGSLQDVEDALKRVLVR